MPIIVTMQALTSSDVKVLLEVACLLIAAIMFAAWVYGDLE